MAIDAYAVCPGGTGKKIKFCCPDLLPELEKMGRMLDGQQFQACCQHLDRLMEQGQRRACLMAMKGELLRATNQVEAGEAHTAEFLERFPDSPVAWAESAMWTALGRSGREAVPKLQRAIALSEKQLHTAVYDAISLLAEALAQEGDWAAARALWRLQAGLAPDDPAPIRKLMSLGRSAEIPLLMKDDPGWQPCPAGVWWQARFEQVSDSLARARWQEAAERLAALAQDVPDAPAIWHNLAIVRGWLADDDGAIAAWRKYAGVAAELEDAVEAEALAMLLSEDPLGDAVDLVRLSLDGARRRAVAGGAVVGPPLRTGPDGPGGAGG